MSLDDRKALRGATCAKRKRSGADRIGKTFAVRQSYGERVAHMTGEDQVDAGLGKYQSGGLAPMNAAGDSDRPGLDERMVADQNLQRGLGWLHLACNLTDRRQIYSALRPVESWLGAACCVDGTHDELRQVYRRFAQRSDVSAIPSEWGDSPEHEIPIRSVMVAGSHQNRPGQARQPLSRGFKLARSSSKGHVAGHDHDIW